MLQNLVFLILIINIDNQHIDTARRVDGTAKWLNDCPRYGPPDRSIVLICLLYYLTLIPVGQSTK